jgi:hypothetical protein
MDKDHLALETALITSMLVSIGCLATFLRCNRQAVGGGWRNGKTPASLAERILV